MSVSKLSKVELYRFFKSILMFVLIGVGSVGVMLLISSDTSMFETDLSYGSETQSIFKMMGMFFCIVGAVGISVYVGNEFKYKTIYHEIMKGYSSTKIALSKTISCGFIYSFILWSSVLIFLMINPSYLSEFSITRLLLIYIYLFHICSCTLLYVMLCRNGATGGCLAFCRFEFFEVLISFLALLLPDDILVWVKGFLTMSQWSYLTTTGVEIPMACYIGIIFSTVIEYFVLMLLLSLSTRKGDY
ncbi:MAG: hypothetical protein IJA10_13595 [Lachnospiraceae bacterium]|nr:hypothetical protein [Lachnospiraceae bacterium]